MLQYCLVMVGSGIFNVLRYYRKVNGFKSHQLRKIAHYMAIAIIIYKLNAAHITIHTYGNSL